VAKDLRPPVLNEIQYWRPEVVGSDQLDWRVSAWGGIDERLHIHTQRMPLSAIANKIAKMPNG
jgi:hypothetical protein